MSQLPNSSKNRIEYELNEIESHSNTTRYTIDTLKELNQVFPSNNWYLVIGTDQYFSFHTWKKAVEILNTSNLIIVQRGNSTKKEINAYFKHHFKQFNINKINFINCPAQLISSTEIRKRIKAKQDISALVPKPISDYIKSQKLYIKEPLIVGLTGRAGSGKSYATNIIHKNFNVEIIDLDTIGHTLLEDLHIIEKSVKLLGDKILDRNLKINRKIVGKIVFNDSDKLRQYNQIIHPEIKKSVIKKTKENTKKSKIICGALIQEIGLSELCDILITIDTTNENIQKFSPNKINIATIQKSRENYIKEADFIISNNFDKKFINSCVHLFKKVLK